MASLSSEFRGHGLLQLLRVHSVAFGGAHKNVVSVGAGSLIGRIQQGDFQKQLAEFGLVIRADLLCQQFLRGIGVLLDLYLVPLRQSRDLAVGQMCDQVLSDDLQVRLLQRSRNPLQHGRQYPMAGRDRKLLLLDSLAFRCPLPLNLFGRRRVRTMHPASWIGTNLDDVSALASVRYDGLGHACRKAFGTLTAWRVRRSSLPS